MGWTLRCLHKNQTGFKALWVALGVPISHGNNIWWKLCCIFRPPLKKIKVTRTSLHSHSRENCHFEHISNWQRWMCTCTWDPVWWIWWWQMSCSFVLYCWFRRRCTSHFPVSKRGYRHTCTQTMLSPGVCLWWSYIIVKDSTVYHVSPDWDNELCRTPCIHCGSSIHTTTWGEPHTAWGVNPSCHSLRGTLSV